MLVNRCVLLSLLSIAIVNTMIKTKRGLISSLLFNNLFLLFTLHPDHSPPSSSPPSPDLTICPSSQSRKPPLGNFQVTVHQGRKTDRNLEQKLKQRPSWRNLVSWPAPHGLLSLLP